MLLNSPLMGTNLQNVENAWDLLNSACLAVLPLSDWLASFPGPSPPRRGLVHTACACAKYSVIFP